METTRLRLDLAYDGTDFSGWAMQPGLRTVQGELQTAIAMVLRLDPNDVRLTVGGRTDAGVHARGQVAHLDVTAEQFAKWAGADKPDFPAHERMVRRLMGALKRNATDIHIHDVRVISSDFDARFSALRRRYEYRVRPKNARRDPLTSRFTAFVPYNLDLEIMQNVSASLVGLQDFTTFCKAREGATAIRDLLAFEWRETEDGAYAAHIEADAFCHSMVRALIGSVVSVGQGRIGSEELIEIRDARTRTSRFAVMPALGLSLEEITYPSDEELAARAELTRARRVLFDE